MIAFLEGTVQSIGQDHLILLTQGVGYQVFVTRLTLEALPPPGTTLKLHTHLVVREDSHQLYGFKNFSEKSFFLKLIQVNSVGPKLALTILSGLPVSDLADAIYKEDLVRLTAIPGVGKKTAERLVVDLKDKIFDFNSETGRVSSKEPSKEPVSVSEEALSALTNLGYSRQEALKALQSIPQALDLPLEALVREGLKALS